MRISVVINTIDRAHSLARTLEALKRQTYTDFEILVVVGPTKDQTLELLSQYADTIRLLRCPTDNLSQSRNIGICASTGEIVAFIDDDALPARCWLNRIAELFKSDPALAVVGGKVFLCLTGQERVQHQYGVVSSIGEHSDVRNPLSPIQTRGDAGMFWTVRPMGTNMAFRRTALLEVGGFDEFISYIAEESELALRMAWQGYKIKHSDDLVVYHLPASSRNRTVFTTKGRWYHSTRSLSYFAIKNGRMIGEPFTKVLSRILYLLTGRLHWYRNLHHTRAWSTMDLLKGCWKEIAAFVQAVLCAFLRPRRLIKRSFCKLPLS